MQKLKFFLLIGLFVLPILALGADITLVEINPNIPPGNSANDPGGIVSNFYQFALIFSGVLAFIVIIWAGIKYAIAAGNPSGQSDAKQWIYSALIGLLLLSGGGIILNIINKNTFKIENGVLVVPGIGALDPPPKINTDNNACPSGMTLQECNESKLSSGGGYCFRGACLAKSNTETGPITGSQNCPSGMTVQQCDQQVRSGGGSGGFCYNSTCLSSDTHNADGSLKSNLIYGCTNREPDGSRILRCTQNPTCDNVIGRCDGSCYPVTDPTEAQGCVFN